MSFIWRDWERDDAAGVSGWDAGSPPVYLFGFLAAISVLIVIYFPLIAGAGWIGLAALLAATTGSLLTLRYDLAISRCGYRLRRSILGIPWYVRSFSRHAVILSRDDEHGDGQGLWIYDDHEDMANPEQRTPFGVGRECWAVEKRLHELAARFSIGTGPSQVFFPSSRKPGDETK